MLAAMEKQVVEAHGAGLTAESEGLNLPPGMELHARQGSGRICTVYRATFQGETVALKAYHPDAVTWFRNRHSINIAVHEMAQNRAFRQVPELLPYTAKPIRVIGQDGSVSLCFLQEFINGQTVAELAAKQRLPEGLLLTSRRIAQLCADRGLQGLDQFMRSTLVREHAGQWTPVIHDFKHLPADTPAKTTHRPSLLSRLGLGGKNTHDPEFVKHWLSLQK
jgi:hypothetical protein